MYKRQRMYILLGKRLKELRTERKLTQKRVADDLGLQTVTYLRYEKSQREPPLATLAALTRYYNVTSDYLLGLSDERK